MHWHHLPTAQFSGVDLFPRNSRSVVYPISASVMPHLEQSILVFLHRGTVRMRQSLVGQGNYLKDLCSESVLQSTPIGLNWRTVEIGCQRMSKMLSNSPPTAPWPRLAEMLTALANRTRMPHAARKDPVPPPPTY